MSMSNLRSWWSDRRGRSPASLLAAAGRDASFETLESRVLLSDPGSTFDEAQELILDGDGQAMYDDKLPDTSDVDMYRFTVTSPDFITLLADAVNTADEFDDRVDTRIEVFDYLGNSIGSSNDSGKLTGGTPTDAWFGFVPTDAHKDTTDTYTYYVRVTAQTGPLNAAEGLYTMRVDGQSTEIVHNGGAGEKVTNGTLTRPLEDIVYRVTTDDDAAWESVATANARADDDVLDTRLDIYDSTGSLIVGDSQAGRLTNAFAVFKSGPDQTLYFRIRSDEFAPDRPHTGAFNLGLDLVGKEVSLDHVSRMGYDSGTGGKDRTELFQFVAQSSGTAIISAAGTGMIPLLDPSLTLYDSDGEFLAFNDRFFGDSPQIESTLVGGETYFILVDGFDYAIAGQFHMLIESAHTFVDGVIDDHADSLDFDNATPIVWSDWQVAVESGFDPDVNYKNDDGSLFDHPRVSIGSFTGRVHRGADTDVFVFVPPVDMLGSYTGNREEIDEDGDFIFDRDLEAGQDASPVPWIEDMRPATRVEIQVQAFEDPGLPAFTWADMQVRVYDSNGTIVYGDPVPNGSTFDPALYFPTLEDPAGALDPARWIADLDPVLGLDYTDGAQLFDGVFSLEVWGGEPYYIEVSTTSGSGRYNAFVAVDGFPDPTDESNWSDIASDKEDDDAFDDTFTGISDDTLELDENGQLNSGIIEVTNNRSNSPSDFAGARNIDLDVSSGAFVPVDGSSNSYLDSSAFYERSYAKYHAAFPTFWTFPFSIADQFGATMLAGRDPGDLLGYGAVDNDGVTILQESGLTGIEHPLDNDLYVFRAASTGFAEIRINTTQLSDWFQEYIADGEGQVMRNDNHNPDPELDDDPDDIVVDAELSELVEPQSFLKEKVYNSILDSALRIFNNDFEQLAFNNDNNGMIGQTETTFAGVNGDRTFHKRDARVVFPITKGEIYYVQVESGQAEQYQAARNDPTIPVAWKHLIGSYELLGHTMPTITNDDFLNDPSVGATVIGIDEETGVGTVSGEIDNHISNPTDADFFTFTAPASAEFTVTASRQSGETVIPAITIYEVTRQDDGQGNITYSVVPIADDTASSDGSVSLSLTASKGQRFMIEVIGAGSTEGLYDLEVSGFTVEDDHADWLEFQGATEVELLDFLGSATVDGAIESNGDTDVLKFEAGDFADATITVTSETQGFNPFVEVYEVGLDPYGHPVLLRLRFNDDISADDSNAQVSLGLTPGRLSGDTGLEYPFYYVVVRGSDLNNDEGEYVIDFDVTKTDDHPDAGQYEYATPMAVDSESGQGQKNGTVEVVGDTDLLRFTALAGGTARITVSRPTGSVFLPKISILDSAGNELDVSDGLVPGTVETAVTRGQIYFVLVEASTVATGDSLLGDYTVAAAIPPLDDYPNAGEWSIAHTLTLDSDTGDAILGTHTQGDPLNPRIDVVNDTDLFTFRTIATGSVTVTFAPLETSVIGLRAELSIFDADLSLVQTVTGVNPGEPVSIVLTNTTPNQRYYILVGDALGNRTGEYQLSVDGNAGGGGDGGGGGGDIDFDEAIEVDLDPFNADGTANGVIGQAGERDLFAFTAPASGTIYVQLVTPRGSLLDGTITILDAETEEAVVTFDATGIPGVNAAVRFASAGAGQEYWVIVDGIGTGVGSYTLKVDAEPEIYRVFYPAGFTAPTVREFVSLANPNDFEVTYSIILHYETGERDLVVASNQTLAAGSRGGITISNGPAGSPVGARFGPYAIEVRAVGGPVAASLGHFDFGATTGDAFTSNISPLWSFARLERDPGVVNDFMLYFNPHDFDVEVTLTAYDAGGNAIDITTTVGAQRRGGLNLDQVLNLPTGVFGAVVTARAADPANDDAFLGIIAGQSHFDLTDGSGFGLIGDPAGGGLSGAVPHLTESAGVSSELVFFNPNPFVTTVTITGKYVRTDLPNLVRTITLGANETQVWTGADLGFIDEQPLGISYVAGFPITVTGNQTQFGDADSAAGATQAGTGWFFGAGFMNSVRAGDLYFETLSLYNPTASAATITVSLFFYDGTTDALTVVVGAQDFAEVRIHETLGSAFEPNANRPDNFDPNTVLGRPGLSYFSMVVSAPTPIVANFTHYDLYLQGGWSNSGAALGPVNPLYAIT